MQRSDEADPRPLPLRNRTLNDGPGILDGWIALTLVWAAVIATLLAIVAFLLGPAAAALEFLPNIANVEAHSGAADLKPASTSSAKRFFVAEETDAGEFHTWLWRALVWCQSFKEDLTAE